VLAAVIGVLVRFATREYLVSELEPTAAPKTVVGAPQSFAQEDQPLERSRRRASFHYARRRHRTAASRGEGDEGHLSPAQGARRSYGRDGSGFWLSRRLTSFWQSQHDNKITK